MSCAISSITDGMGSTYDAGLDDETESKIVAPTIYGRARERFTLVSTFQGVLRTGTSKTICLHGCSGSGKTALVEHFREFLCQAGSSLICSGKFFQNPGVQEPYSAFMAAFSELCDLVTQLPDFDEERKLEIRNALGSRAQVFQAALWNAAPFLDSDDDDQPRQQPEGANHQDTQLGVGGSAVNFKVLCKAFLRSVASGKNPVVLFLDDIQWMDEGSRSLIEMCVNDSEVHNVLFILAYREENQVRVKKDLSNLRPDKVIDLGLGNLNSEEVAEMVAGWMQAPRSQTDSLSVLVKEKTSGNAFHVIQFLDAIQASGLLVLDSQSKTWSFDIEAIQNQTSISDSLADLLVRKIQRIPIYTQTILKIASLLGYSFEEDILFEVVRRVEVHPGTSKLMLDPMISAGPNLLVLQETSALRFTEKSKDGYKFSHDKVQAAFQSMLTPSEKLSLHQIIGDTLFLVRSEDDDSSFRAAAHLNKAVSLMKNDNERLRLAHINVEASKYCWTRSAFRPAASFLRQGMALIEGDEKWKTHFDLAFEMTEGLARLELSLGNFDLCEQLTEQTLLRATSVDMKIDSLLVNVEAHLAQHNMAASVRSAYHALGILGVQMPKWIHAGHVGLKFKKIRSLLKNKEDEDILRLPLMRNRATAVAARILLDLHLCALFKEKNEIIVYSSLRVAELTLCHGLSPHSAHSFLVYACIELAFGNDERAYRFGKLGMRIMEQVQSKESACATTNMWVGRLGHNFEPIRNLKGLLSQAINCGFQVGDPVYTAFAVSSSFALAFFLGENLPETERFMRATYSKMRDLSRKEMLRFVEPPFQLVLNLQSDIPVNWLDLTQLSGEVMDEAENLREFSKQPQMLQMVTFFYKACLFHTFGFMEQAEEIFRATAKGGSGYFDSFGGMYYYMYASLTFFARYRETGQRDHLRQARKWQNKLQHMEIKGCPNVSSFLAFLNAEEQMGVDKPTSADVICNLYDVAIAAISRDGYVNFQALANERAGFALAKHDHSTLALGYFRVALVLFRNKWGAKAKFEWLKERVSYLVQLEGVPPEVSGRCENTSQGCMSESLMSVGNQDLNLDLLDAFEGGFDGIGSLGFSLADDISFLSMR